MATKHIFFPVSFLCRRLALIGMCFFFVANIQLERALGEERLSKPSNTDTSPLNIILINADDLGYGDLGCYGQKVVATPNLDRMAREGMRFTQFYAGSTVCAPSRSVLMTGLHTGHTPVRGNGSKQQQTLPDSSLTIAEICRDSNYRTALIGKWGLGEEDTEGHPLRQGFDFFYGYLNQVHAHNHYPEFLWRNTTREKLPNVVKKPPKQPESLGGMAIEKRVFANQRFVEESVEFLKQNKDDPFFLYLALALPHANNEARAMSGNGSESPNISRFKDKPWNEPSRGFAAMISDLDESVGTVLETLRTLGVANRTLVLFTSDNGPHQEAGHDLSLFQSSGNLRGTKRALYEGGIRVPLIAWLPGSIQEGQVSAHIGYQADILPTIADSIGAKIPENLDGLSLWPTLNSHPENQREHKYLYWEFYEQGSRQAVRFGAWKAIREPMLTGPIQLYHLTEDESERVDVAGQNPKVVAEALTYINQAHQPSERWKVPAKQ
jgi:arylsulfatase A-like enzyme